MQVTFDIGKLSEPATELIKKVSEGIGGFAKPWQIGRVSKAEGQAALTQAEVRIEIQELERRALQRWIGEEARDQKNIEDTLTRAIPLLEETAKPGEVSEDWIANFFKHCRSVSDDQMQELWSRILAGEANAPGSFMKRTVDIVGSMDRTDATIFCEIVSRIWTINEERVPLVTAQPPEAIPGPLTMPFKKVKHLEGIGLVEVNETKFAPNVCALEYGSVSVVMVRNPKSLAEALAKQKAVALGNVDLSLAGEELARVCGRTAKPKPDEYVKDVLKGFKAGGYTVKR